MRNRAPASPLGDDVADVDEPANRRQNAQGIRRDLGSIAEPRQLGGLKSRGYRAGGPGRNDSVTSTGQDRRSTVDTMHGTADALERSEAVLHDSAEKSPDKQTKRRLHDLGDEVTGQAKNIDQRADAIEPSTQATS
jgi:hypothetical protein